jgi:hypothetical protein
MSAASGRTINTSPHVISHAIPLLDAFRVVGATGKQIAQIARVTWVSTPGTPGN